MKYKHSELQHLTVTSLLCCSVFALTACDATSTGVLRDLAIVSEAQNQSDDGTVVDANDIGSNTASDTASNNIEPTDTSDNAAPDTDNTSSNSTVSDTASNQPVIEADLSLMQGYIDIDIDGEDATALFTASDIPVSVRAGIPNAFIPNQDECVAYHRSGQRPTSPEFQSSTVSAGDVITITAPAGTLGELQRTNNFGNISYQIPLNSTLSTAVPAGTVVDIPGEEFPTFTNVLLPEISAFDVDATTGAILTTQTGFTWTPNRTTSETYIRLLAEVFTYTDINDPATFETIGVTCHLLDDGSYRFPEDLQEELGEGFNASPYYIARKGVSFERQGNALLAVVSSSEQEGTPF